MNKLNLLSILSIMICLILTSCQKENETLVLEEKTNIQNVDKDYFKSLQERYEQTDEASLTEIDIIFQNNVSDIKKFESQEDFEMAAMTVLMDAKLSNGEIKVHESLKNLDFEYASPELATFFNQDGKLIVGNIMYDIISDTEQIETDLLTKESIQTLIVDFEDSRTGKDDPIYEYKTVSFILESGEVLANADYEIGVPSLAQVPRNAGWGNISKFEVQCMQRVWRSWGCRKGRAETNVNRLWNGNLVFDADQWNTQDFCDNPSFIIEFKSEVFNPRKDGEGTGCWRSRANNLRKKNTGVTSTHSIYMYNILGEKIQDVMEFDMD